MRSRLVLLAAAVAPLLAFGSAQASSLNGADNADLLHVGQNPNTCDAGNGGPSSGNGQIKVNTKDNTVRINIHVHGAIPNTNFTVDLRCMYRIGSFTTDADGSGEFSLTLPTSAVWFSPFYLDTYSSLSDVYVAGPFSTQQ